MQITDRTRHRRRAQRGTHAPEVIAAIVDEALVCHVAIAAPHGPLVLPTTHARVGDDLVLHGAAGNGILTAIAEGAPACVAITLLDALVMGKSAMHHSVNYRSVVVFGRGRRVDDPAAKRAALAALLDKVEPGRSAGCRAPDAGELAATLVIAIPLAEASAKVRTGPPIDDAADAALPYWSGIVPLATVRGAPNPPRPE